MKIFMLIDEYLFAWFDAATDWKPSKVGEVLLGLCAAMLIINFLVMSYENL